MGMMKGIVAKTMAKQQKTVSFLKYPRTQILYTRQKLRLCIKPNGSVIEFNPAL